MAKEISGERDLPAAGAGGEEFGVADVPYIDLTEVLNASGPADVDAALKNTQGSKENGKRLEFLDELRGFCVLAMVIYHGLYLLGQHFGVAPALAAYQALQPWQPGVAAIFILLSGVCVRFSSNIKVRALQLLVWAAVLMLVTILLLPALGMDMRETAVWFGVLHLLGFSKLLYHYGKGVFEKIPKLLGMAVSMLAFVFTFGGQHGVFSIFGYDVKLPQFLYQTNIFVPLGFHKPDFYAWDYFPLLPWFFLFLFASFLGRYMEGKDKLPDFCYKRYVLPLGFFGKHALLVYLLHLPVMAGIFVLIRYLSSGG
ncbi:MAG: DUF1624 domain-containing protein [Oscillospiraceae bacterium]|nr:DUF1624 domain-containing protein [Oscillospiraceae bacterium]